MSPQTVLRGTLAAAASVLWSLTVAATPSVAQEKPPSLTIILDASRSMWGQIDGINKIVIARTVLGETAKRYEGRLHLGLVSYGHRESNACNDIELLANPGPYKAASFAKTVNSINPKGSTPIAASLEIAAKAASRGSGKTSLLLLSDGLDNCSGDPCAVAKAINSRSPSLPIHVVAFDRKEQQSLKQLSCIADATGGSFAPATSEKELSAAVTAAIDKAIAPPVAAVAESPQTPQEEVAAAPEMPAQGAQSGPSAAPAPPPDKKPAEGSSDPQSTKAAKGETPDSTSPALTPVSLTAKTTDGGETIPSGLVWRIFEPWPDKQGKYKLLGTHRTATLTEALAPGEYMVAVSYGSAHLEKVIQVQAGVSFQEELVLNAGGLRLTAALTNGKPLPPNSVRYDVFAGEPDQRGHREKILGDAKPGIPYRLNSGPYHVVSVYGDANAVIRSDVAVEPGKLTDVTFNHSGAKVTFKLVMQPGGEALADTQWSVLTPGGDVVKESAGALATHILAAGEYSVLARHGGKNYTRDFQVEAGESKQIEVVTR
jgi:Mg-chelatase subunit ChlD